MFLYKQVRHCRSLGSILGTEFLGVWVATVGLVKYVAAMDQSSALSFWAGGL